MLFRSGQWKKAKVSLDYHIEVERHYYSVPYWFVSHEVQVKVGEQLVEIFHEHQRIACHERSQVAYRHTTLPEHMPPEHWAYKQQSKERFLAWAEQVGTHTKTQVQAIFERKSHEEQAFRTLKGIQRLAQQYGLTRLETACHHANIFGLVGLRRLRSILENQMDTTPLALPETPSPVTEHANVRGADYYR